MKMFRFNKQSFAITLSLISFASFRISFGDSVLKNISARVDNTTETKVNHTLDRLKSDRNACLGFQCIGQRLLNDVELCDIDLEVMEWGANDSKVVCAHKSVLSVRSDVLKERIKDLMTNSNSSLSGRPRLTLEGLNPNVFEYVLQYIYTEKFDSNFDIKKNVMDLYDAAKYLQLNALEEEIKQHLTNTATLNDLASYILWADQNARFATKMDLAYIVQKRLGFSDDDWPQFSKAICAAQVKLQTRMGINVWKQIASN